MGKQYIFEPISRYERRINRLNLEISLKDVGKGHSTNYSVSVRKHANIQVSARLLSTDEPIRFDYTLHLGLYRTNKTTEYDNRTRF